MILGLGSLLRKTVLLCGLKTFRIGCSRVHKSGAMKLVVS